MGLESAFVGAKCFDTVAPITPALAKAAKDAGYACAVRYLGMTSVDEIKVIRDSGLAVLAVTTCRGAGWIPTPDMGKADGAAARATATRLGLDGVTCYYDIEGVAPACNLSDLKACINNFAAQQRDPGMYVGAGSLLTSHELYMLGVRHYWRGLSREVDRFGDAQEPGCGYGMVQLYDTQAIAGVPVDISFIQKDYLGRFPTWLK